MQIKFLPERALLMESRSKGQGGEKTLVIADLHIGLELELSKKGITLPPQLPLLEKRIGLLLEQTKATRLILLGDIKHETTGISWSELWDVPEFLQRLKKKARTEIVKGNHDGGIEGIVPADIKVHEPSGLLLGDVLLAHGQAWPHITSAEAKAKTLIIGHIHPAVEFWSSGARQAEHVFLKAAIDRKALEKRFKTKSIALKNAIIMPTFNLLMGGVAFNSERFKPSGPLLEKVIEWKKAQVWLLDGTFLGTLDKMKIRKKKEKSKLRLL